MKRRDFISFLASAAVAAGPAKIRAQLPSQLKRIGALMPYFEHDAEVRTDLTAFGEKLQQLGWAQGQNLQLDVRWAGGNVANLQSAARELVARSPSLLFARSTAATRALQRESRVRSALRHQPSHSRLARACARERQKRPRIVALALCGPRVGIAHDRADDNVW